MVMANFIIIIIIIIIIVNTCSKSTLLSKHQFTCFCKEFKNKCKISLVEKETKVAFSFTD